MTSRHTPRPLTTNVKDFKRKDNLNARDLLVTAETGSHKTCFELFKSVFTKNSCEENVDLF